MAGYNRQQIYYNGDVIFDQHTNLEYDKLVDVFESDLGHRHSGSDGEGGLIPLLSDYDKDTFIHVEEVYDNDRMNFYVKNDLKMYIDETGVHIVGEDITDDVLAIVGPLLDALWFAIQQLQLDVADIKETLVGVLQALQDLSLALSLKQDTLVSGQNIKTINGESILGSGDLVIEGGGTGPGPEVPPGVYGDTVVAIGGVLDLSLGSYFRVDLVDLEDSLTVINYPLEFTSYKIHVDLRLDSYFLSETVLGNTDLWLADSKFSAVVGDYNLLVGTDNKLTLTTFDGGRSWYVEGLFDCNGVGVIPVYYISNRQINNNDTTNAVMQGEHFYNTSTDQFEMLSTSYFNSSADGLVWEYYPVTLDGVSNSTGFSQVTYGNGTYVATNNGTMYYSLNGYEWFTSSGIALSDPNFGVVADISFSEEDQRFYVLTTQGIYLRESFNGIVWSIVNIPANFTPDGLLRQFGGTYYVFTQDGSGIVYESTNGGANWSTHSVRQPAFASTVPVPSAHGWVYFNNTGIQGYGNAAPIPTSITIDGVHNHVLIGVSGQQPSDGNTVYKAFFFRSPDGFIVTAIDNTGDGNLLWTSRQGSSFWPFNCQFAGYTTEGGQLFNRFIYRVANAAGDEIRNIRRRNVSGAVETTTDDVISNGSPIIHERTSLQSRQMSFKSIAANTTFWFSLAKGGIGISSTTGLPISGVNEFGSLNVYNINLDTDPTKAFIQTQGFGGSIASQTIDVAYAGDTSNYQSGVGPIDPTLRYTQSKARFINGVFYQQSISTAALKFRTNAQAQLIKEHGKWIINSPQSSFNLDIPRLYILNQLGYWDTYKTFFGEETYISIRNLSVFDGRLVAATRPAGFPVYRYSTNQVEYNPGNLPGEGTNWELLKSNGKVLFQNFNNTGSYYIGSSFTNLQLVEVNYHNGSLFDSVSISPTSNKFVEGTFDPKVYVPGLSQKYFRRLRLQYNNPSNFVSNDTFSTKDGDDYYFVNSLGTSFVPDGGLRESLTLLTGVPSDRYTTFASLNGSLYAGSYDGTIYRSSPDKLTWTAIDASPNMSYVPIQQLLSHEGKLFVRYAKDIFSSEYNSVPREIDPITCLPINQIEYLLPPELDGVTVLPGIIDYGDTPHSYPIFMVGSDHHTILRLSNNTYGVFVLVQGAWIYVGSPVLPGSWDLPFRDIAGVMYDYFQKDYVGYLEGDVMFSKTATFIKLGLTDGITKILGQIAVERGGDQF